MQTMFRVLCEEVVTSSHQVGVAVNRFEVVVVAVVAVVAVGVVVVVVVVVAVVSVVVALVLVDVVGALLPLPPRSRPLVYPVVLRPHAHKP